MNISRLLGTGAVAGLALCATLASTPANATHWRGGSIAWTANASNPNEITFEVTTYWRRSFFGTPNLGDGIAAPYAFSFGDAGSVNATPTVFSLNAGSDWIGITDSYTHTYAGTGSFTAGLTNCCRLSSLQNNGDGNFGIQTNVTVGGTDGSPNLGGSSPIFLVADGGIQVFNPFTLTDPDGGTHSYALATAAEGGGGFVQPTGLSINAATGDVTWDTDLAGTAVGQLWSVSFMVTDNQGNTAPLDILLSMCTSGSQGCNDFEPPEQQVPAPGALSLAGLGLLGVAALRRRRRVA